MTKPQILVIGGAGYIGSCMVRMLSDRGFTPIVFDNLSTGHRSFVPGRIEFIEGDLKRPLSFDLARFRAVMHFAASSLVGESVEAPLKYYENNVSACVNLLNAGATQLIFSSSCAVYGEPGKIPISEETPLVPVSPYGRTKRIVEDMLADHAAASPEFRYVSLRYFNAAGAHRSGEVGEFHTPETHLIPNVFRSMSGEPMTIFGDDYPTPDGTCVRDYIHVEDICDAHLRALDFLEREKSRVFNLGNGEGYSVKEVIAACEKTSGRKANVKVGSRRAGDPPRLVGDASRAQKDLGWKPVHGLKEIVESAWKWEMSETRKAL